MNLTLSNILEATGTTKVVYDGRRRSKAMSFMDDYEVESAPRLRRDRYSLAHAVAFALYNQLVSSGLSVQLANYVITNTFTKLSDVVRGGDILSGHASTTFHVGLTIYKDEGRYLHVSGTLTDCVLAYQSELAASIDACGQRENGSERLAAGTPTALKIFNATDAFLDLQGRLTSEARHD